jgi:hypothetical protein
MQQKAKADIKSSHNAHFLYSPPFDPLSYIYIYIYAQQFGNASGSVIVVATDDDDDDDDDVVAKAKKSKRDGVCRGLSFRNTRAGHPTRTLPTGPTLYPFIR